MKDEEIFWKWHLTTLSVIVENDNNFKYYKSIILSFVAIRKYVTASWSVIKILQIL